MVFLFSFNFFRHIKKIRNIFVHANIIEGFNAFFLCISIGLVTSSNILFFPSLMFSFAVIFLYNINLLTDMEEDSINYVDRSDFFKMYKIVILAISFFLFIISILFSFTHSIISGSLIILPVIMVYMYSFLRLKKYLILKNILVGLGWAILPFFMYSFTHMHLYYHIIFSVVIFISILINSIIYDIKDIAGDLSEGIRTIPNKFGITVTKKICYILTFILSLIMLASFYLTLIPFNYIFILSMIIFIWRYIYLVEQLDIFIISEYIANLDMIVLSIFLLLGYMTL